MLIAFLQKETSWYIMILIIYVHLHSFFTNFSPYCFTDTQTDPSISVSPLFPNLITLFSLSSFVSTSHRSLALSLSGWGEEAIVISMETAQQQAWSWQPIRVCFGTVSHPMRRAEEEAVQGGVVGSSRWIFGEAWTLPGWSENIGISELRRGNFPVV